jgi:uncharacterized protein with von Willebrand factor type A (vWA) domain
VRACPVFSFCGEFLRAGTELLQRTLPIAVLDSHEHVIYGLAPSDFSIKARGQPARVLSISPDNRPHRIVVLLDESGSMASSLDGRAWEVAREIALHIAQSNLENTSLALMIFSDKVHEQIGFSQDNTAVLARLQEIGADPSYVRKNLRGQTATYDAILSAVRLLDFSDSSNSIYLISDGDENRSQSKFGDVNNALGTRNVRLHLTLLASGAPRGLRDQTSEQLKECGGYHELID